MKSHAVVAVLDTGINPYHPVFRAFDAREPREIIEELPPYQTIALTFDRPYAEAFKKDRLDELQRHQLYWFHGTRILAYSSDEEDGTSVNPVIDDSGHGTAVASLVATSGPHAFILALEALGEEEKVLPWVANASWVDVVSISSGALGNVPLPYVSDLGRSRALQTGYANGQLNIGAAGNEIVPAFGATYQGPPWTIAVGGVWSDTHGETVVSAKTPDFVSEFVAKLANHATTADEWHWSSGTSYSAPIVSGVLAETIYQVRHAWKYSGGVANGTMAVSPSGKNLSNADLRLALNNTAVYWRPTEYSKPNNTECTTCVVGGATLPVLPEIAGTPIGPWLQMGWGFVDGNLVPQLVSTLLGADPVAEKSAEAQSFMRQVFAAREAYWGLPRQ